MPMERRRFDPRFIPEVDVPGVIQALKLAGINELAEFLGQIRPVDGKIAISDSEAAIIEKARTKSSETLTAL